MTARRPILVIRTGADAPLAARPGARDTALAFVSRAPQAEIQGLKERHGWEFIPWYTITDDFDADFGVDQWHGHNAFIREGDRILPERPQLEVT